jgi:peptidoglycan glycosyltransferase
MLKLMLLPITLLLSAFLIFNEKKIDLSTTTNELNKSARQQIAKTLGPLVKANRYPADAEFNFDDDKYKLNINYTLDTSLQKESDQLLKKYKPDYGAIFMIDAKTGRILAMSSFQKSDPQASNLNLRASFPAASVFKVITASAAIDHAGINPDHKIAFNGGNYTLYKRNVLSEKINRWTRFISLKEAFAKSINTAFGRLAIENIEPKVLNDYAEKFMFNSELLTDFPVEQSRAQIPDAVGFELSQVAAGYNRFNTLSPAHGAMIAASIINEGRMPQPYIVDQLTNAEQKTVYKAEQFDHPQIISAASAAKVQSMMEQTVLTGTSRKTFRKILREKKFSEVEMGGKTGHFSGDNPKGRTDWFIGYATDGDNKVAIAAITVNIKKWTVKSSALGEMMFRKHFKSVLEEKEISKIAYLRKNRG